VGIQARSAIAQHVRSIPDHKHSAGNTCLYERIFIQFLRRTKDEDTQLCQQSLHAGCPNDHLPILTRHVQNSSSRQAASSIPRICGTSRLVLLGGIKSIICDNPSNSGEPLSHRYAIVGITDDVRIIKTRFIKFGPRPSAEMRMVIEGTEKVRIYAIKAYRGRTGTAPTHS
jgi:hypothetical protein